MAFVARLLIFFSVGFPLFVLAFIVWFFTPGTDGRDLEDVWKWVWTVEYARD